MSPEPEYGSYNEVGVRLRLDKKPPENDTWAKSTNEKALFVSGGSVFAAGWIERFQLAHVLTFQFTPFHSSPATTTFQLKGLSQYAKEIFADCPHFKLDDD